MLKWTLISGASKDWAHWELRGGNNYRVAVIFRLPNKDPEPWMINIHGRPSLRLKNPDLETAKALVELLL